MTKQETEQNRKSNNKQRVQHESSLYVAVKKLMHRARTSAAGTSDTSEETERTAGKETVLTRLKRKQVNGPGD